MTSAFAGRFLLGVNYWARAAGPRMWERYDRAAIRAELAQMKSIGLDCCRLFAFAPTFMPRPPAVDAAVVARFAEVLADAGDLGIGTLPTALVGHMSGENFDFPGQAGRSLYRDPELLVWQRALVEAVVSAGQQAPSVLAWVLSNEMPLWGGAAPADEIASWCEGLCRAIRARDSRPIGTGDGTMFEFPTRQLAPLVDYVAPHLYYGDADPLRQAWAIDLAMRAVQPLGRPVVLEEFGCSSTQAGESEQAAYFREAIFAAFSVGARGAIGWCFSDFDPATLGGEAPYSHHGFELGFGITRKDGSEKPVCDELRSIRRFLDRVDLRALRRPPARVAILRSSYLTEPYPFSWEDRAAGQRTLLQAFVLASQAGLDPDVVSEDDDLASYALVLVPATQKLRTPTWTRLLAHASAGATIYWSYSSGDHPFHQGAWCPLFEPLTGLRHRLRYGCFDLPPDRFALKGPELELSVATGVAGARAPYPLARLVAQPIPGAPVRTLAVDQDARPALTVHAVGSGQVAFLCYPLERYLAERADGSQLDAHRLYAALGELGGVRARYPTHHPHVQSRVLVEGDAADLVVVQHRGWTAAVDDATDVPRDAEVLLDASGRTDGALGPKGVRVYRVAR